MSTKFFYFYTLFLLTESIAALGIPIVPSACLTGDTSTGSQSIGASAAANILMLIKKEANGINGCFEAKYYAYDQFNVHTLWFIS